MWHSLLFLKHRTSKKQLRDRFLSLVSSSWPLYCTARSYTSHTILSESPRMYTGSPQLWHAWHGYLFFTNDCNEYPLWLGTYFPSMWLLQCMQCRRPQFDSCVGKIHWRRDTLPTSVLLGFPCGSAGKESTLNAGDLGSIPGLGRSPKGGKGYPFQYSGLEKSMDCIVHGVTKSDKTERLSFK